MKKFFIIFWGKIKILPKTSRIIFEVIMVLLIAYVTFFILHWYQTKQQMAKNVYAVELPKGVTKNNLSNLTPKQKTQLNNKITSLLNQKINQSTTQSGIGAQPIVVVLTQNNQSILPTVAPPTSVPPTSIPSSSPPSTGEPTQTPTPTSLPTPTPTVTPTPQPALAFVAVPGNNFLVSNIDNGQGNWYTAKAACAGLTARLPTMVELNILYQQQGSYNFKSESYWSKEESGNEAYYIHFSNGFNNSMDKDFTFPYFRCVKGTVMTPTPTPTVTSCTDSDGRNYFTKGVVRTASQTLTDVCYHTGDPENVTITGCAGTGCNVKERYCQNDQAMTEIHPCPYNCGDGACIVTPTPTLTPSPISGELCSDSDGGRNFYIKGRTVPAPGYSSNQVGEDSCISSNQLNEYYCHEDNKHLAITQPNCPAGCMSGVCLKPDACTDSDGGENYYEKGFIKPAPGYSSDIIYWDKCLSTTELEEQYCHPDGKHAAANQITCSNGNSCQDGVCLGGPPVPQPQCGDSDGGANYLEKGRVVDKNGKEYFDHCVKDQVAGADPNYLAEYSCQYPASMENVEGVGEFVPEEIFVITYNCSLGCQDEICLNQPISPAAGCSDSDGINYYLKGELVDKNGKSYKDFCVKDQNAAADPDYLAEYACQAPANNEGVAGYAYDHQTEIYTITYNCPNSCSGGKGICNIPVSQASRSGFSFTQEAREAYEKQNGSNLVDDVNKIYFNGKKISGLKLDKEIGIQSLGSSGLKINYYNASTNEIVFGEKTPTRESLVNLIAVSLADESLFLKPKTYEEEFKKINTEEINRQVFEPNAPTSKPEVKPTSLIPTLQPSGNCAADWKDYQNEKFAFKFKIPSDWTDTSIDERQSETLVHRSFVSTTRPEEQMDPKYKLSLLGVLASTSDLKTDEDYGRWFDDNTGNQKKSSVNFKGITAEKYIDETETFCSSQTDQNPVNCPHRFERYYFKKGTLFYLINIGIYLTPEVKDKNEKILSCFLDNFAFLDSGSKTESNTGNKIPNNLKKCTQEIYDLKIGCNNVPNKPVCGFTKSVYDNGESEVGSDIFKNACRYCSQFDPKTGFSELRGTKFYMVGYKEGICD